MLCIRDAPVDLCNSWGRRAHSLKFEAVYEGKSLGEPATAPAISEVQERLDFVRSIKRFDQALRGRGDLYRA
ncbi:hypothetical protein [Acidiphilium sp. C61]|jgi:hypothetical protein|uniref:hypothetical protein n=1 Tax=Acidiphilium sp. C61 TaxID=1671485 RepID=UPI00157BAE3B|nr:hypothetical protein [Acidiphilium sp. C61]